MNTAIVKNNQSVAASSIDVNVAERIVRVVEHAFPAVREYLSWETELSELEEIEIEIEIELHPAKYFVVR
ncbi:hypothetical protein ATCC90586_010923 [Pythium insidiosum]|nr:hypothetical protein ATCC90586_010923 [Pythium insidiosum]